MSDRVVMIMIPRRAMDVLDFTCILNSLPLGSKVVDVRDAVSIGYNGIGFVVENDRFEEVPIGQEMSKVYPTEDFGGTFYIEKDDLPLEKKSNNSPIKGNVSFKSSGTMSGTTQSLTNKNYPAYNIMGVDEETEQVTITKNCTHYWVNYQGLIHNFTYCSKCDKKKQA